MNTGEEAMRIKTFDVILERDEGGWFIADVPALAGCHTQGKTKHEALANIKEAIELCLEELKESKKGTKSGFVGIERVKVHA